VASDPAPRLNDIGHCEHLLSLDLLGSWTLVSLLSIRVGVKIFKGGKVGGSPGVKSYYDTQTPPIFPPTSPTTL
jgi:hypothetical protein